MESELLQWAFAQGPAFVLLGIIVYVLYKRDQTNEEKEERMIQSMQAYWEEKVEAYQERLEKNEQQLIALNKEHLHGMQDMTLAIKNLSASIEKLKENNCL